MPPLCQHRSRLNPFRREETPNPERRPRCSQHPSSTSSTAMARSARGGRHPARAGQTGPRRHPQRGAQRAPAGGRGRARRRHRPGRRPTRLRWARPTSTTAPTRAITTAGPSSSRRSSAASWRARRRHGAKLIVMENLYLYGPHGGVPMTEETPQRGVGPRSTTRRAMSAELFAAHRSGQVRAASVRASDLFGPHVRESLAGERLFGPALAGKPIQLMANPDLPHSLTYAPDAGRAMVAVGADDAALGQAWHVPNAPGDHPARLRRPRLRRDWRAAANLRAARARWPAPCCRCSACSCRRCAASPRTPTSSTSPTSSITAATPRRSATTPRRCPRRSARRCAGTAQHAAQAPHRRRQRERAGGVRPGMKPTAGR